MTAADTRTDPIQRIREDVRSMHAYPVQDARGLIKLDAMENPYRLSPELQAELGRRLGAVAINRYPGADVAALQTELAAHVAAPEGWSLMLGNGSDELIGLLALACAVPAGQGSAPAGIMAPQPGFVMYELSAQLQGLPFFGVPLQPDFALDEAAMLAAIAEHRPAILYLAYPNNPTGTLWDATVIQRLIDAQAAHGALVVMDEAYQPFAAHSWIEHVRAEPQRHGNVLIMRTLSKFGLAGVRLGYLLGPQRLVAELDKVRPPYNVSVLNAECARFALAHAEVFAGQAAQIRAERERLQAALAALPGVTAYPSQGNMVLLRVPDAARTFEGMKARGVLVKNVSKMHPMLHNCLRLTVGSAEECAAMLAALQASL